MLIAIILDRRPCFGFISCTPFGHPGQISIPDTGCVAFYGGTLLGAVHTAGGSICTLQQKEGVLPRAVISSSRSMMGVVQEFVSLFSKKGMIDPVPMLVTGAGEKSRRMTLRAESEGLWFFPKEGTSLWDAAASDALLRSIGGKLTDKFGHDMDCHDKQAQRPITKTS
jgi:3'-phosphoadenosine 5'-phosphosulfate (PAPS) 3'-phosphatase